MNDQEICKRAIVVLALSLAVYWIGCGTASDSSAPPSAAERDRQLLEEASLSAVQSGLYDATFFVDNETRAEAVQWRAVGPFVRSGDNALQMRARYEFAGLDGQTLGSLLVLGDRTMFRHGGNAYRLPLSPSGQVSRTSRCRRSLEGIDFAMLVKNVTAKPEPGGESTALEGDLRLPAVFAALHRVTGPCGDLLSDAGVSPRALGALEAEVKNTFKKSEATFTVGNDHVLTGISLGIWVESPVPKPEEVDGTLTINLSRINEVAAIRDAPSGEATDTHAREPTAAQRSAVEGWIGLVNAVFGSLASD